MILSELTLGQTILRPLLGGDDPNSLVGRVDLNIHGRHYKLVLDSTYPGLWISGTGCQNCPPSAAASSSASRNRPSGNSETQQYSASSSSGSRSGASCEKRASEIKIADFPPRRILVCAANSAEGFSDAKADGYLGLAGPQSQNDGLKYVFSVVKERKVAFYWDHPLKYGGDVIGQVGFGGLKRNMISSVKWVEATGHYDSWTINSLSLFSPDMNTDSEQPVLIDTGNHQSHFETPIFNEIIKVLGAKLDKQSGRYLVQYSKVSALSKLTLRLGLKYLAVDPMDLVTYDFDQSADDMAYLAIKEAQDLPNVIGTNILSRFHLIFDYDNSQIGFSEPIVAGKRKMGDNVSGSASDGSSSDEGNPSTKKQRQAIADSRRYTIDNLVKSEQS